MDEGEKVKVGDLFIEQQKLNRKLFFDELSKVGETMDYKEEKLQLELAIYQTNKSIEELKKLSFDFSDSDAILGADE